VVFRVSCRFCFILTRIFYLVSLSLCLQGIGLYLRRKTERTMSVVSKFSVSAEAAHEMLGRAIAEAKRSQGAYVIAIVDESGILKALHRMDGAPLISVESSIKKARLAAGFGFPTGDAWYNFIKDDPILLHGAQQLPDFILLGGGSPIMHEGQICGAIGVSGGHYKQDEAIVAAALGAE
jgi:uncharacterized protein GlcG (DUF336 family)